MSLIHLGNTDLTSNRNTAAFTLNGATSTNKLEVSNGTNAVLHIAGNNTVWCRGAGNISTNTSFGEKALDANTTGTYNSAFGLNALGGNLSSSYNTAFGGDCLRNSTSGSCNTAFGAFALLNVSTSSNNVGIGYNAGRYITGGATSNTTPSQSIFIGQATKASADGQSNQIVIGYATTGNGSNTATIGNSSIVATYLGGQVKVGSFASAPTGIEGAIYYDSVTKKHYGFDGTSWNALY